MNVQKLRKHREFNPGFIVFSSIVCLQIFDSAYFRRKRSSKIGVLYPNDSLYLVYRGMAGDIIAFRLFGYILKIILAV